MQWFDTSEGVVKLLIAPLKPYFSFRRKDTLSELFDLLP